MNKYYSIFLLKRPSKNHNTEIQVQDYTSKVKIKRKNFNKLVT